MSPPSERPGSGLGHVAGAWLAGGRHPQEARVVVSRQRDGEERGPRWGRNCSMDGSHERKRAKSPNKGKRKSKVVEARRKEKCN